MSLDGIDFEFRFGKYIYFEMQHDPKESKRDQLNVQIVSRSHVNQVMFTFKMNL